MAYPPETLVAKYGKANDGTARPGRLANVEGDAIEGIDLIVAELGPDPSGAYPNVQARLDALAASTTPGMRLSVRAATVLGGTYTLATSFANGQVLDGVTLVTGNSIALVTMTDATQNGIYTVNASGAPTRRADFANGADFPGAVIMVREGTVNKGRMLYNTNTSTPTLGSTAITFSAYAIRPVEITVGTQGSGADFITDGVADEAEVNLGLFLASLAALKASVRFARGDYTFSSPVIAATVNSGRGVEFIGSGREVTRILRSADCIAIDASGTVTGTRSGPIRIADLKFFQSVSPHTQPAIRAYYTQDLRLNRVDFATMQSMALLGLELQDSSLTQCRLASVGSSGSGLRSFASGGSGSTGTGGRPAILLLGATNTAAATGAPTGYSTSPCSNVTISDTVFTGCVDGAILVHGNAADENYTGQPAIEHSGIHIRNCRFDASSAWSGWAPQVYVYRARNVTMDLRVVNGTNFGAGTPQALIDCDTVVGLSISRLYGSLAANNARSFVRVTNVTGFDYGTIYADITGAGVLTQAVVEYNGSANTLVRRGTIHRVAGTATPSVGTPASEYATSGSATIAAASSSVSVAHRLPRTPVDGEVHYSVVTRPSGGTPDIAVTYSSTQITLTTTPAVSGSSLVIAWRATVADNG